MTVFLAVQVYFCISKNLQFVGLKQPKILKQAKEKQVELVCFNNALQPHKTRQTD